MINRVIPTVLPVLGLLAASLLFAFRGSIRQVMPVALQSVLGPDPDQRPAVATARSKLKVSAEKVRPRVKQMRMDDEEFQQREISVLEIVVPMPPFPSRSEVRMGMSLAELIARFGEPNVTATWSDYGTVSERLIYQTQERSAEILLQDGKVVSTHTDNAVP
jgi:hypothetical protein